MVLRSQRFRAWAHRLDRRAALTDWRPAGLELADEATQARILADGWPRRFALQNAVVVGDDHFVSRESANTQFGSLAPDTRELAVRGVVQPAFRLSDGAEGITRESFEAELVWRTSASLWSRFKRALSGWAHYL